MVIFIDLYEQISENLITKSLFSSFINSVVSMESVSMFIFILYSNIDLLVPQNSNARPNIGHLK